jgi:hypothetical protein
MEESGVWLFVLSPSSKSNTSVAAGGELLSLGLLLLIGDTNFSQCLIFNQQFRKGNPFFFGALFVVGDHNV